MVSIRGFKRPADGTGTLLYYPYDPGNPRYPPLIFTFGCPNPWTEGRPAPFAWRLLEPFEKLKYPILDLVADRHTWIYPPLKYLLDPPKPSTATPFVRIFRPQIEGSVPQEEGSFDGDSILGNEDRIYGTGERYRGGTDPRLHKFYIHHLPVGSQSDLRGKPICVISQIEGAYRAEVYVKNVWGPTSYFVAIDDTEKVTRSHEPRMYVFTDKNISLKNIRHDDRSVKLHVHHVVPKFERHRPSIPMFSDGRLPYHEIEKGLFNDEEIRREFAPGYWWRQFVQSAEDLIGLIPVVGDVYGIGAAAYMAVTGKAPWTGDRVTRAQAIIYAAAAIGPIGVSQVRRLRGWGRSLPGDLVKLSDDPVQNALEQIADPETVITMASAANDQTMRQLQALIRDAASRKLTAKKFATSFTDLLSTQADLSTLEKRFEAMRKYVKIDDVFETPSKLKEPLAGMYEKYLKRSKHLTEDVTPLEWCRRQTSGSAAEALANALGPNFSGKLRVLAGAGVAAVRPETFKRAIAALTDPERYWGYYKDLHSRTRGLSPVTERDHIFEKRFFLNNPDFSESMDMFENSLAVLVPANQDMLAKLREIDPKLHVWYAHADKRPHMQRLPDGREHEFPLQALWDVHIDTYRQMGVKITPNGNSFGALVYQDLVQNLDYLADDMRIRAATLHDEGRAAEAAALLQKAGYRKRFDPKDRAFRSERFQQMDPGKEWWLKDDS